LLALVSISERVYAGQAPCEITISAINDVIKSGDPLKIQVTFKNNSEKRMSGSAGSGSDYVVHLWDDNGYSPPRASLTGVGTTVSGFLEPGSETKEIVSLDDFYNVGHLPPGHYPTSVVWSKSAAGSRGNARDTTERAKLWC